MNTFFNQRWNGGRASYRPKGEVINPLNFDVAEISEAMAKSFILRHHYSSTYPSARRRFGLFERGKLSGVAVFSHPCNERTITNVFGCERASDGLELGRFVLLDSVKANGESWFLARCKEILKKDFVGFVSFSDDTPRTDEAGKTIFAGHIGTIYQASNALFVGRGKARKLRLLPNGTVLNERSISKLRGLESGFQHVAEILYAFGAAEIPADYTERKGWLSFWLARITREVRHPGNLKYVFPFTKKTNLISLPYPKITLN